jgi:hypothetical protein
MELREQFVLPRGSSQAMSNFRSKTPNKGLGEHGYAWNRSGSPTLGPIVKVLEMLKLRQIENLLASQAVNTFLPPLEIRLY